MLEGIVAGYSATAGIVVAAVVLLIIYAVVSSASSAGGLPPAPSGWPIFGNMTQLGDLGHMTYFNWSKELGPIINTKMGSDNWIILNDFESFYEAFMTRKDEFSSRPVVETYQHFMKGMGINFVNGRVLHVQKQFSTAAFHGEGTHKRDIEKMLIEEKDSFMSDLASKVNEPQSIKKLFDVTMVNMKARLFFGKPFDKKDPVLLDILEKSSYVFTQKSKERTHVILMRIFPLLRHLPPFRWTFASVLERTDTVLGHIKDIIQKQKDTFDENNIRNFVDEYLLKIKENTDPSFTEDQCAHIIWDIFVVIGQRAAYGWAVLLLLHYPEIQEKIYSEIMALGEPIEFSHRKKMPYTRAFIHESHRFRTAVCQTVNYAVTKDVEFRGFTIPKDSQVIGNIWAVHHEAGYWQNPDEFRPERFIDEKGEFVEDSHVITYGFGSRSCFGRRASEIFHFHMLTSLVQRFKVTGHGNLPSLNESDPDLEIDPMPYQIVVKERQELKTDQQD